MKVAGIQYLCVEEKGKNTDKAMKLLDLAVSKGASIICFQELFNVHWFPRERKHEAFQLAEEASGETVSLFREVSEREKVLIVLPFFEREASRFYNTAIVIEDGKILGRYRKIHIPDIPFFEETFYFDEGDLGFPVFQTRFGTLGIQISWDNLYSEGTRILAIKGAEILFAPTACAFRSQHIWQTVISGNAITNGLFAMRVNRTGSERGLDFYGMSFCVNPEGELIAGPTGMADSILFAEIDLEELRYVRRSWPIMKGRRPSLYREVVE
jgi:N-carbamoylputrescine amidase